MNEIEASQAALERIQRFSDELNAGYIPRPIPPSLFVFFSYQVLALRIQSNTSIYEHF